MHLQMGLRTTGAASAAGAATTTAASGAKAITLAPTMALGDVPFEVPCTQHGFSIRTVAHSDGKKYAIYFLNCETVGVAALT